MQLLILSVLIAFVVCIALGPVVIPLLKRLKFGQQVRDDGPKTHLSKSGTPTMGGIIIIIGILVSVLTLSNGSMEFVLPATIVMAVYGLIGFLDDFIKIKRARSLGLRAYQKIIGQFGVAVVISIFAYNHPNIGSTLMIPFTDIKWDLGIFYIPFAIFVILCVVNSVNLTDGLDGLASGVTLIYAAAMAVIYIYLSTAAKDAGQVLYYSNLEGMIVFCGAVAGACLGFIRFNTYPAQVFMGDTGSLSLGGAVAMMSLLNRGMLLIPIMGGCFAASAISVALQVGSYKLRKKRIFKMAPLHHHFELLGYPETKIVVMYMIVTVLLCLVAILSFA